MESKTCALALCVSCFVCVSVCVRDRDVHSPGQPYAATTNNTELSDALGETSSNNSTIKRQEEEHFKKGKEEKKNRELEK